tara:strand:- start:2438 stop:2560 length:123 start_codon:yes stop_codon:yes gene_type:complete
MQQIIVYIILAAAICFLAKKFIFKSKKKDSSCGSGCGKCE